MGSAPHAAQRMPWAVVAQAEGPTEGGEDMALQEGCADGGLQAAGEETAGNDADGGTSCFQGAELRSDVDRLVEVAKRGVGAGAGGAPVALRSSGPEIQGRSRREGGHVLSATSEAPDKFWADVDRGGPGRRCRGRDNVAGSGCSGHSDPQHLGIGLCGYMRSAWEIELRSVFSDRG